MVSDSVTIMREDWTAIEAHFDAIDALVVRMAAREAEHLDILRTIASYELTMDTGLSMGLRARIRNAIKEAS